MSSEIVIFSLATWRIANMLVNERGPFELFVRIREIANIQHDEDGFPMIIPDNLLAGILSCVWCCSIWVAFGFVLVSLFFPIFTLKFATIFAISAGAILIDRLITHGDQKN